MCIIVYKPQNVKMPESEILKNCFENNDDGAGFMYAVGGKVHIVKGLMTYDKLMKALIKTVSEHGQYIPMVIHFRWSTQAGVRKDCTHPFPLSKNMADLRKLKTECEFGVAHNGVIYLTSSQAKNLTYNDTMEFITDYLSLIIKDKNYYKNKDTIELINRLSESKLAIMDGSGHCELTGYGWIEDKGVYYSNNDYLLPKEFRYIPVPYEEGCLLEMYGDDSYCTACHFYDYCYGLDDCSAEDSEKTEGGISGYLERFENF